MRKKILTLKHLLVLIIAILISSCSTAFDKFKSLPPDKVATLKTSSSWVENFRVTAIDGVKTGNEFINAVYQDARGTTEVVIPAGTHNLSFFWKGNENSTTLPLMFNAGTHTTKTWQEFSMKCDVYTQGGHTYVLSASVDSANNITLSMIDQTNSKEMKITKCITE